MRRGQGSLEYLLILAAILALAVIVVLIANSMLGTPKETAVVNQDKYNFALQGWEIRGYDRPYDPNDPGTRPETIAKSGKSYGDGGSTPVGTALIGAITGGDGTSYPVYVGDDEYYIGAPPSPACAASIPLAMWAYPSTDKDGIVSSTASGLGCYAPSSVDFEIKIGHTGTQTDTTQDYLLVRAFYTDGSASSVIYDYCAANPSATCVAGELPKVEPATPVDAVYTLTGINPAKKVNYFAYRWFAAHSGGTFTFNGGNVLT